jgi:flagellar hook-associated protein 3 FlgL
MTRITSTQMLASSQRNMQATLQQLARLQEKASSQKEISRPSDDPVGTATAMRVRGGAAAEAQYERNMLDGEGWLVTVDSAFSAATDILLRVRDLTMQAANSGAMSDTAREAIATELDGLREDMLRQANTTYLGRPVFAGSSGADAAFDAATYTHTGSGVASDIVERRVGSDTSIRVDADGAAAFGDGVNSAFALIDRIAADLRAGTDVAPRLTDLDTRRDAILGQQALSGARYNQLERAQETNMQKQQDLAAQRAAVEDVDIAEVLIDLKSQELAYQSALAVTSRALQPSLLSFLA